MGTALKPTERVRTLIDITWGLFLVQSGRGEEAEKILLTARASISQLDSPAADKKKLDERASAALSELRQSRVVPGLGQSE